MKILFNFNRLISNKFKLSSIMLLVIFKMIMLQLIFIGIIVAISIGMFYLLGILYLDRDYPYRTGEHSLLGLQPGLSLAPRTDSLTSLIRFRVGWKNTFDAHVNSLYGFVQSYEKHKIRSKLVNCKNGVPEDEEHRYSCEFSLDIGNIGCNLGNSFGYDETYPCVALKINRIFGWLPSFNAYNNTPVANGFPTVKIKCEGVNDSDKEILRDKICYYDEESALADPASLTPVQEGGCSLDYGQIRNYYFPYKKQYSYQIPFIWIKFLGLKHHIVVMVQCWIQADNVYVDFDAGMGSVSFELLVD